MTYVEELAREVSEQFWGGPPPPEGDIDWSRDVRRVLSAISTLAERGDRPKLVRREPTAEMSVTNGSIYWETLFDAAPAVPEEEKKVR